MDWYVDLIDSSPYSSFLVTRKAPYFDVKYILGIYNLKIAKVMRRRYRADGEYSTIFKIPVWPQIKERSKTRPRNQIV